MTNPAHEHTGAVLVIVSTASRDILYLLSACDTFYSDYVIIMYIHVYICIYNIMNRMSCLHFSLNSLM